MCDCEQRQRQRKGKRKASMRSHEAFHAAHAVAAGARLIQQSVADLPYRFRTHLCSPPRMKVAFGFIL